MKTNLLLLTLLYFSFSSLAQTDSEAFLIKTKVANFVPAENFNSVSNAGVYTTEISFNGFYYQIIQFYTIPNEDLRKKVESQGVKLLNYLPQNAYIAAIPENFDLNNLEKFNVRSINPIPSIYKMNPKLGEKLPEYASNGEEVDIILNYYSNISISTILNALSNLELDVLSINEADNFVILRILIAELDKFSQLPFTEWMELVPEPGEPEDRGGRTIHRSNIINNQLTGGYRFDGTGVNVLVRDDGLVGPHIDYTGRLHNLTTDATGTHGDGVAGVMAGGGNIDPTITGMAPGADVYVINYTSLFSSDNTLSLHQNDNVNITNSSYSNGCNDGYTTTTQVVDDQTFQNPNLLHVFSAGNSGTSDCGYGAGSVWGNITGGHKIGKNVIATANLNADGSLLSHSSRGPAADGRLKPDIAAHGQGQLSTDPNNAYQSFGGTSAAAPGIAGVAAQLSQAYRSLNGGVDPEAALIKAILLNTADEMGNLGPDFKYGWGRVNAGKGLTVLENNNYLTSTIAQGITNSHNIAVPANVKQVKVMVYWPEEAPASIAGPALINNLDMVLTTPDNTDYLPWILDPTPNPTTLDAPATRGVDNLNNVEQVTLDNPTAGNYILKVTGSTVPSTAPKYYVIIDYIFDELKVSYPLGGEGLVPNTSEYIHWDAFGDTGNFTLEYTINDGNTWTNIATVNGTERLYAWTIPSTITGQARIKISRGGLMDESDQNFSIINRPTNISYTQVCPNSLTLTWDAITGATGYDVYLLGNKYMDVVGSTTNTEFEVSGINGIEPHWFSIRATGPNNLVGRRANAVTLDPTNYNCNLPNDLYLQAVLSPSVSTTNCNNSMENVQIEIRNLGTQDASNFEVGYQLNNGTVITENYSNTITASSTVAYTFNSALTGINNGQNNVLTWVKLTGDAYTGNDTFNLDFQYLSGLITLPYTVNFNDETNCSTNSNCGEAVCPLSNGWLNESNNGGDDIDWRVYSGSTPSSGTGPTNDYDVNSSSGKYLYLETSGTCTNQTASLVSPCINLAGTTDPRFSFFYHMYGTSMGELHIDLHNGTQWINDFSSAVIGDQGNSWLPYNINLSAYKDQIIQLRIRGITGTDFTSDIALDLFQFRELGPPGCTVIQTPTNGSTGQSILPLPIQWTAALDATGYAVKIGTTSGGEDFLPLTDIGNVSSYSPTGEYASNTTYYINIVPYNGLGIGLGCTETSFTTATIPDAPYCENVEGHTANTGDAVNFNDWNTTNTTNFKWTVRSTTTPSSNTGPANAYKGSNYFYTEASNSAINDTTSLYSPTVNISTLNTPYLTFFYHMYGAGMGSLQVDINDGNTWNENVWSLTGQQQSSEGEDWRFIAIPLAAYSSNGKIGVRFKGVRGNDFTSDMAIDDICFVDEAEIPVSCVSLNEPASGATMVNPNTLLSWSSVLGATGYKLKIGTTPTGDEFLPLTDVGNVTTYDPLEDFNHSTTYVVSIFPYNGLVEATDCLPSFFRTDRLTTIYDCGELISETYCYGNNENTEIIYNSIDLSQTLTINLLAGGLETGKDKIIIYDGNTTNATELYSGDNGGDLAGLSFTSSGPNLLFVIETDASINCHGGGIAPIEWTVKRTDSGDGEMVDCECDPTNIAHQNRSINGMSSNIPQINQGSYHASMEINSVGQVENTEAVLFKAGNAILLRPGFHAKYGSDFVARIETCTAPAPLETPAINRRLPKDLPKTELTIFPNPFFNETSIQLALPEIGQVELVLYDQLGREVKQLAPKQMLEKGLYNYRLDGNLLESGLYFLQLRTSREQVVKKIIKARR